MPVSPPRIGPMKAWSARRYEGSADGRQVRSNIHLRRSAVGATRRRLAPYRRLRCTNIASDAA